MWRRFYFILFLPGGRRNTQLGLVLGSHCEGAVRTLLLLALLHPQPTPLKPTLQLVQPLAFLSRCSFSTKSWTRSVSSSSFASVFAYASRASVQDSLKIQPRDWDLVRPLWSSGGLPKCYRRLASVPVRAGMSPLLPLPLVLLLPLLVWLALLSLPSLPGAVIFGVAAINAGAGVAAVVDTADFGPPGWGR